VVTEGSVWVATGIDVVGAGAADSVMLIVAVALLTLPTRVQSPAAASYTETPLGSAVDAHGMHALWSWSNGPGS